MGTEIERKWLLSEALPAEVLAHEAELIEQGYLVIGSDGSEVRLRRKGGQPVLTVKSAGTISRSETEIDLAEAQYEALWPATEGRRVIKRRRRLDNGIEVDVYEGALEGLAVAELEFESEAAAGDFAAPDWFGDEVTEDRAYKNQQLALRGRPPA
jgi:adenylate cyclase